MTTCQPALITWSYQANTLPDPLELTLVITNQGVAQPSAPSSTSTGTFNPPGARRSVSVTQQIVADLAPSLRVFTWDSVNVTAGFYEITATLSLLPDFAQTSSQFVVANGSDVSCIAAPPSSSATSSSPTSSSGSPTSTGGASPSPPVTLPVTSGASSKVNRGAIAGGVIGGLAVSAAAIAAYFYFRYASASTASRGSSTSRAPRKWAGLGSTDSKAKAYPSAPRSPAANSGRHHSQSDSVGPMLSSHDSNVYVIGSVGIDSRPSRINDALEEEDEVNSYFSPSQEKISSSIGSTARSPFSESGHGHDDAVPLEYIAPLHGNAGVTRNSSTSTSSYMNNNFSRPRSHPSSPYSSPTTAEGGPFSDPANNTSSSLTESPYPPTPSPAFPSGTSAEFQDAPPPPRRGSAGEPVAAPSRRTPRKPVPQYNPTDPSLVSPPPPMPTPLPPVHDSGSDSSREGSLRGGRVGAGAAQGLPRLAHKGSFGDGRPVHYLIPDMPPPPRG
ncbi:hypothetical protein K438DRAFT_1925069 [Mycena galopus ATCC 62051]|nr:hypothetical protein K438DRAFT_1925069 [Mycena galopus ATCC 62051]